MSDYPQPKRFGEKSNFPETKNKNLTTDQHRFVICHLSFVGGKLVDVTFCKMNYEHLNQVFAIEQASYASPWSRSAFLSELKNSFAYYIVGLVNGQTVGFGGMWLVFDEAQVTNVAVHPDYRMNDIGKLLMLELIRRAALMGCFKMTLEVRPSNMIARRLYAALGFVEKGLRKKYYTDNNEDAIIMWLNAVD